MIKSRIIYLLLTALVLLLSSCDKESKLSPTEDLGIVDMFSPDENADPRVKTMYNDYGVWVRTYFSSIDELTNSDQQIKENEWKFRLNFEFHVP